MFVLDTGCRWRDLPEQLGCGSGHTAWRRLREWQDAAERLGISQASVSKIENGKAAVEPDLVRRWLIATDSASDELLDELSR